MCQVLFQVYVRNMKNSNTNYEKKTFRKDHSFPRPHEMPKIGLAIEINMTLLWNQYMSLVSLCSCPKALSHSVMLDLKHTEMQTTDCD